MDRAESKEQDRHDRRIEREKAERDELTRLREAKLAKVVAERDAALKLANFAYDKGVQSISAELAEARKALHEIADEADVHTKLNQERLCCKFQDIASRALSLEAPQPEAKEQADD